MHKFETLIPGSYYHIYNHAAENRDLFILTENYEHFLDIYDKFISPVAETFAWVLMKNHFHFLVRIKENLVYKYQNADRHNENKWETSDLSACAASDSVKTHEKVKMNSDSRIAN
ncbi:MAG: hypothetical protein JW798_13350 [Prolixibacteraceae bacterium]|nr:hypothetical protein [Prolixibacteraceae bacterium]